MSKHKCRDCDFCEPKRNFWFCWKNHSVVQGDRLACNAFVEHENEAKKKGDKNVSMRRLR